MKKESQQFLTLALVAILVLASIPVAAAKRNIEKVAETLARQEAFIETSSWGLSFQKEGQPPVANATSDFLSQYDACYCGDNVDSVDGRKKKIYLTFDAGYENGNTEQILDALQKHGVTATFFLVGNYIEQNPELVKRMLAEGHTVGNHTYHHPDMGSMSTLEDFRAELESLEALYLEVTGEEMSKYYRPPQGKYSEANLQMAKELGYKTVFWSLAYVDWYENDQPTADEAYGKLLTRIHDGAIVLLHSTSKTNAEIMDDLLTKWEEMGYAFDSLDSIYLDSGV